MRLALKFAHKMKGKRGFTLIECMVYVALVGVLSACAIHCVLQHYGAISQSIARSMRCSACYLARDLLVRDIRMAQNSAAHWHMPSSHYVVWRTHATDIGWEHKDDRLIRYEGHYNPAERKWHAIKKSTALMPIKNASFALEQRNDIIHALNFSLQENAHALMGCAHPRGGST